MYVLLLSTCYDDERSDFLTEIQDMLSSLCMKKRRAFNTIIKCSNGWTQDIRGKIKWRIQPLKDKKILENKDYI